MKLIKFISEKINPHPAILYSISKLLNDIGSSFYADGLIWISNMLSNNPEYSSLKLESSTTYYLENLLRKYVYENQEEIKKKQLKQKILFLLNFLIERGSTVSYILRENII